MKRYPHKQDDIATNRPSEFIRLNFLIDKANILSLRRLGPATDIRYV